MDHLGFLLEKDTQYKNFKSDVYVCYIVIKNLYPYIISHTYLMK